MTGAVPIIRATVFSRTTRLGARGGAARFSDARRCGPAVSIPLPFFAGDRLRSSRMALLW